MEYLWLIFVILAAITRGVFSFSIKIATEYDSQKSNSLTSLHFFALFGVLLTVFSLFFVDFSIITSSPMTIITGLIAGSIFYINFILTYYMLQNLSSSFVFINSRILTSISVALVGVFFFNESITIKILFGLIFGIITFICLYDTTDTPRKNANFKLGVSIFFMYILLLTIVNSLNKINSYANSLEYLFFAFFSFSIGFWIQFIIKYKKSLKEECMRVITNKRVYLISSGLVILMYLTNVLYLKALELQDFIIIYKIYSFEILIPVLLSILIYKEKVTLSKAAAFVLSIITILFFV